MTTCRLCLSRPEDIVLDCGVLQIRLINEIDSEQLEDRLMIELNTAWEFGSALGLGVLIGMERERTRGEVELFAGVRTFALVALFGSVSVYASEQSGLPWLLSLIFISVLALVITAYQA
ncbi:MAG: MgtC/SapB family protein, partial [Lysobacterales bacterium]